MTHRTGIGLAAAALLLVAAGAEARAPAVPGHPAGATPAALHLAAPVADTVTGEVVEVRGLRVRIRLPEGRLAARGDTVRLGSTVEGLGEVALEGTWRVTEVDGSHVWADPAGRAEKPAAGYWARIAGPAGSGTGSGSALYRADLDALAAGDGVHLAGCRLERAEGGLVVEHVGDTERAPCRVDVLAGRSFGPGVRVRATVTLLAAKWGSDGYGLTFGLEDPSDPAYHVLVVTSEEGYGLARIAGTTAEELDATMIVEPTEHPAIQQEVGSRNALSVELDEDGVHYSVNGQYLGRFEPESSLEGHVGLLVTSPEVRIRLEELVVEPLEAGR